MSSPAQSSLTRLEEIVGSALVLTESADLSAWSIDGAQPWAVVKPTEAAQVAEIVRCAAADGIALVTSSGRSKLGIGLAPERYDVALDLSRMNRVLAYDPEDLTLGVEPGVRIEDLHRTLGEQKQFLPLAVPFTDRATLGGIAAANSNSPMRHSYGGVRDFCLGMEFVTGDGLQAKSGGRVVKNVTGYDLHKLLIGSLGTLAVITRLNFRTFPIPPVSRTFVATFGAVEPAFAFCRAIAKSVLTPEIVEIVDPEATKILAATHQFANLETNHWTVLVRAVGHSDVVERYGRELTKLTEAGLAAGFGALDDANELSILGGLCEFPRLILDAYPQAAIFRIGVLSTAMPALFEALRKITVQNRIGLATMSRGTGFVYAALLPEADVETSELRQAVTEIFSACADSTISAQTMLEWGPADIKAELGGVWGAARPDFGLMKKMKDIFDPHGILSPGRFMGGS